MSDVVRAELFKLVRRPAAWVLLLAALVLSQVFSYLIPYLSYVSGDSSDVVGEGSSPEQVLASTLPDQLVANATGGFPVFAGALALVLGALVTGGEYGWGTVKTMLTQRPGRASVLAGQLSALLLAVVTGVGVLFAASAATSAGIAVAENRALDWPGALALLQGLGAGALVLGMWAVLGAALGVLLRGVALPIGLGVVWVLAVENLVSATAGSLLTGLEPVRDALPGTNAGSLIGAVLPERLIEAAPGVTTTVDGTRALVTVACYLVASAGIAWWVSRRRDVA